MVRNHVQQEKIRTQLAYWKPFALNQKTECDIGRVRGRSI